MHKLPYFRWLIPAGLFLFAAGAVATRPHRDLMALARDADMVVRGNVSLDSPKVVMKSIDGRAIYVATVNVNLCYKRQEYWFYQAKESFKFQYAAGGPEDVREPVDGEYVLFLYQSEVGPVVLNGPSGMLHVEHGKVYTRDVENLPDSEDLAAVESKLAKLADRSGCDR